MKHIHRFFLEYRLVPGRFARLDDDDAFHAAKVLRLRRGAALELVDHMGELYAGEIHAVKGAAVTVLIGQPLSVPAGEEDASRELTVVQALPKGRRLDMVVEKLSELGVAHLVPVYSDKSVAREAAGRQGKIERWQRIAKAAAGQAKRRRIMTVEDPLKLDEWLATFEGNLLVLSTEAEGAPLGETVSAVMSAADSLPAADGAAAEDGALPAADGAAARIALLIGPEAGFSRREIAGLTEHGARFVSLGPLVLRTETAALVAAAIAMHRLGLIG